MRQSFAISIVIVDCLFKISSSGSTFTFFHTLNARLNNEVDKRKIARISETTSILNVDDDKDFLMQILFIFFHSLESRFDDRLYLHTCLCRICDVERDGEYWFVGNNHSDSNKSLMGGSEMTLKKVVAQMSRRKSHKSYLIKSLNKSGEKN